MVKVRLEVHNERRGSGGGVHAEQHLKARGAIIIQKGRIPVKIHSSAGFLQAGVRARVGARKRAPFDPSSFTLRSLQPSKQARRGSDTWTWHSLDAAS